MIRYLLAVVLTILPAYAALGQCSSGYCYPPGSSSGSGVSGYGAPRQSNPQPVNVDPEVYKRIQLSSVEVSAVLNRVQTNAAQATQYAKGSGTIIRYGSSVAIITAGHVVSDGTPDVVRSSDGLVARYAIRYYDRTIDFAILEPLENQEAFYARGVELFSGMPNVQEYFIFSGYGSNRKLRLWAGKLRARRWTTNTQFYYWIEFDQPSTSGDSGGGIFSMDGRLYGIIWGTDGYRTIATVIDPVTLYLNSNQSCLIWRFRRPNPNRPGPGKPPGTPSDNPGTPGTPPGTPPDPSIDNPDSGTPGPEAGGTPEKPTKPESIPPATEKDQVFDWKAKVMTGVYLGLIGFFTYLLTVAIISLFQYFRSL